MASCETEVSSAKSPCTKLQRTIPRCRHRRHCYIVKPSVVGGLELMSCARSHLRSSVYGVAGVCLMTAALVGTCIAGPLEDATAAYEHHDYVIAMRLFRALADEGIAEAQISVGRMYDLGQGAPENAAEAEKWFRRAADQGIASAQYELGIRYDGHFSLTPNYAEALKWYGLAADQGHTFSRENLARIYRDGKGVPKDFAEAVKWYRLLGDAQNLGYIYEEGGFGVRQNYLEAVKWYRRSADEGSSAGQLSLGLMYIKGLGVPQDYAQAHKWIEEAANQGEALAQLQLGLLYANGQGLAQDFVQSHMWLDVATSSLSYYKDGRDQATRNREIVAAKMTPTQIAQAQALASQCQQQNSRGCGTLRADPWATVARSLQTPPSSSPPRPSTSTTQKITLLENDSGTYGVPVVINGVIALKFTLDSGASDVSIPSDVVSTLVRTGTIQEGDFRGTQTYVMADGSKVPSQTFRIHSLKVGDVVMENVTGSIAPAKGGLLLGQSFLGRLKSWSIDNATHALIIN